MLLTTPADSEGVRRPTLRLAGTSSVIFDPPRTWGGSFGEPQRLCAVFRARRRRADRAACSGASDCANGDPPDMQGFDAYAEYSAIHMPPSGQCPPRFRLAPGFFSRDGRSYDGCLRVRDWSAPGGPFFDSGVIDVLYPGGRVAVPGRNSAAAVKFGHLAQVKRGRGPARTIDCAKEVREEPTPQWPWWRRSRDFAVLRCTSRTIQPRSGRAFAGRSPTLRFLPGALPSAGNALSRIE